MSERVISSGYEPPVSSKSVRLRIPSSVMSLAEAREAVPWTRTDSKALGDTGKIPHRLYSDLCYRNFARLVDTDLAIWNKTAFLDTGFKLRELHVRPGDGDSWANLNVVLVHDVFVQPGRKMTVWVHSNNLLPIVPLRERSNIRSRLGVCEVWLVGNVEVLACHGEGVVDGIRPSVGTDG
jgi:hypothetical protein